MTVQDRILCIDDDEAQCGVLEAALARLGYRTVTTTSASAALEYVANEPFDAIVTALSLREIDGLTLCERILGTRPDAPPIVLTGQRSMDAVIGALRVGVYDFLAKPIDAKLLCVSITRAVRHSKLRADLRRLKLALGEHPKLRGLVGDSPEMRRVYELIARGRKRSFGTRLR
jgi:DNA-binding NtrC family response regulator